MVVVGGRDSARMTDSGMIARFLSSSSFGTKRLYGSVTGSARDTTVLLYFTISRPAHISSVLKTWGATYAP